MQQLRGGVWWYETLSEGDLIINGILIFRRVGITLYAYQPDALHTCYLAYTYLGSSSPRPKSITTFCCGCVYIFYALQNTVYTTHYI